jgi:O-antigen/teichoic acid export membrane protein
MTASSLAVQVFAFGTSVVLAHLLLKAEVGEATEALTFGTLALVIADFGLASVLVQRPELSEDDLATSFWLAIALGAVLTAFGIGASWPIAALYGQPEVQPLFAVLSLVFLLTAPGITQGALLTRDLNFRALELRTIVATCTACVVAMGLAAAGAGPWAIVVQSLVVASVSTVLLWRSSSWRPSWRFSKQSMRGMAGFAGHTFGSNAVTWAQQNVDNFLVGRFLGAARLGAYSIAYSASLSPVNRIAAPIAQVFFPAFSKIRDPARIGEAWLRALRMVSLVVIPAIFGLVILGQEFILVVFGRKWHTAVTPVQLLAGVGGLQALTALSNGILQSIDATRTLWRVNTAIAVASVCAFAVGLHWGIDGVALAYLIASCVVQPAALHVTARRLGLGLLDVVRALSGVLIAAATMALCLLGARALLLDAGATPAVRLVALVPLGVVVYLPLAAWRVPEARREILSTLRGRSAPPPEVPVGLPPGSP